MSVIPLNVVQIQGQGQVPADALNTYVQGCTTAAQLRTFVGIKNMQVALLGIATVDDGNGGIFYWDTSSNTGFVDDNLNVIVPYGYLGGAWVRLVGGGFNTLWLFGENGNGATSMFTPAGVYGVASDGVTDDTNAMVAALAALGAAGGGALVLPPNSVTVVRPGQLAIPSNVVLMSFGSHNPNTPNAGATILAKSGSSSPLLQVYGPNDPSGRVRGWGLRNIMLNCNNLCPGFQGYRTDTDILVECVTVLNARGFGFQCYNMWDSTFINLTVSLCGDAPSQTAALEIIPEGGQDNCNSLRFYGLRVEGSNYSNMGIRGNPNGGPSNNIFFHGCKFHLRNNGTGQTAQAPNLILESADNVCFYGAQIFDGGSTHSIVLFQDSQTAAANYANYILDGCEIDSLGARTLVGVNSIDGGYNVILNKCVLTKDFSNTGTLVGINIGTFNGTFQNASPLWVNFQTGDTKYTGNLDRLRNPISGPMYSDLSQNFQIATTPGGPNTSYGVVTAPPQRVYIKGPQTDRKLLVSDMEATCIYCDANDSIHPNGNIVLELPDGNLMNALWKWTRFLRYDGGGLYTVTIKVKDGSGAMINGFTTPYTGLAGFMNYVDFLWDWPTGNWFAVTSLAGGGAAPPGWPP